MDLAAIVFSREGLILIRWFHLLGAVVWVGGIWFNNMILAPPLRHLPSPDRLAIQRSVSPRFVYSCWASMALVLITGTTLSLLRIDRLENLWGSTYGIVFLIKHFLFFTMMLHSATLTFYFIPRVRVALDQAGSSDFPREPILAQYERYARLTRYPHLITGLLVVLFGSILLRS